MITVSTLGGSLGAMEGFAAQEMPSEADLERACFEFVSRVSV
jgi:hypothetical protein